MQERLDYTVGVKEKFTRFVLRPIGLEKVEVKNSTMEDEVVRVEDYYEIQYPVRREFLKQNDISRVPLEQAGFHQIYTPFERDRVDSSAFISTPHKIFTYAKTFFEIEEEGLYNFRIRTCGALKIWVNGQLGYSFAPYTRNHGSESAFSLHLQQGVNEIIVYYEDLAERDVNFYFELINDNTRDIHGFLEVDFNVKEYRDVEHLLYCAALERDIFKEGNITLQFHNLCNDIDTHLRIRINPPLSLVTDGAQDGNITDFIVGDINIQIKKGQREVTLGKVEEIPSAGLTRFELGVQLSSGQWLTRTLTGSIYDSQHFTGLVKEENIKERKQSALQYFSELNLEDINVGLVNVFLEKSQNIDIYQKYLSAFRLIEEKGDCADFILAPLLCIYTKYSKRFPEEFHQIMKKIALEFRYWIDEPGNDVMWYFSENHALLFHVSQYLAGALYKDDQFIMSQRSGEKQYQIGKQRLEEWFEKFFQVGFSEWNSTTYFPIDCIGFFALYISAPDTSIKKLAQLALDYTFKLIALNYHGGTMTSTFGRVYEHNLKAMQLGEVSNIIQIASNKGYFNNSLRASALFAISDYEPPHECRRLLCEEADIALHAEYLQGDNCAYTYLYKTKQYSLASAISYKPYQNGHQQHVINISLGDSTVLWINNPGEAEFSGKSRPSYWAGNDVLPMIRQYKNTLFAHYKLNNSDYKFIHLYLPFWDLDEIIEEQNFIFLRKEDSYCGLFFSNPLRRVCESSVYGREIRADGEDQYVLVKLSSQPESTNFATFMEHFKAHKINFDKGILHYSDFQHGEFMFIDDELVLNGAPVLYKQDYTIFYNEERE